MAMRRLAGALILCAALPQVGWPDRLTLTEGATLWGQVSRIDADAVELTHCGTRSTILRAAVRSIELSPVEGKCESRTAAAAAVLATGIRLVVKPSRPIDAAREPVDQIFAGSMQEPVVQGEQLMIRRGAPVLLQETAGGVLHITDICLDHGWVHIDVPADPAGRALPAADAPVVFTLRRPQPLLYSVRRSGQDSAS